MKSGLLLTIPAALLLSISDCGNKTADSKKFKGKLEIAGICMNYTIRVIEENTDTTFVEKIWKDEHSGKTYEDVFRLSNPCSFPKSITQGEEFYFILTDEETPCAICEAYYPTPSKSLKIKVVKK